MTDPYAMIRAHHLELSAELTRRADVLSRVVTAGRPHAAAVNGFLAYLSGEVLPHAAAEEKTFYPAAMARADLAGMAGEMLGEHATLAAAWRRLALVTDGAEAAGQAQQVARFFAEHAARENDVLLPALASTGVLRPGL